MTAEERDVIRTERDRVSRERLLETSTHEARRRRLFSACCQGSPVRASNQVRAVMAMLAERVPR